MMDRDAFLAAVIADLSTKQGAAASKSAQQLAEEAWAELQFDLPHLNQQQSCSFRSFLVDLCTGAREAPLWLHDAPAAAARLLPVVESSASSIQSLGKAQESCVSGAQEKIYR